ncbi:polysaccharide pyruvyl transferase family protein [Flavivirga jejuensis]|uniref:Polysaccharide pyruvyl transferase family protein n=1 Tax=Flavivirga jejuensis TaxID=870487 RepID=A0ABT8WQP2_9FLAO|nr:polysaccharide pyruvyl transferase family protein [Flavivirga jejuensis]MDO5975340.1 polysaccharide pyruvyl transferase family protein [Flavivirga jejuensis]
MKKQKSFTITCHRPLNYGAVLQTYALNTKLRELGLDARVIDYNPPYYTKSNRSLFIRIIREVFRLPDWIYGKWRFGKFISKHIPLSEDQYKNLNDLKRKVPKADYYFAGSDQIWNCEELLNGKDDSFFLTFAPKESKKISYAASLAMPKVPYNQVDRYRELINDFDAVSIREKDGLKVLKDLGIKNVINVLDPVFLLDNDGWNYIVSQSNFTPKEKYILVYGFKRQKNLYEYARKLGQKLNVKVYAINTNIEDYFLDIDKYFWNASPEAFVKLIKNSEAVVTNSFHGLSFSIIFNKPFHLFSRKGKANSRMLNLLSDLNLSDRVINSEELVSNEVNFSEANEFISSRRNFSIEFIKNNIN